jgi:hypothetical protein
MPERKMFGMNIIVWEAFAEFTYVAFQIFVYYYSSDCFPKVIGITSQAMLIL